VEVSAAAKIYLEARFSQILSRNGNKSMSSQLLEEHLREALLSPEGCRQERERWATTEMEHLRLYRALRSHARGSRRRFISDYEMVRILGKGSFGTVQLIRHKESLNESTNDASSIKTTESLDLKKLRNQVFAMKIIRKSDMLRKSQEGHLRAERDFLVASERSDWVVPLIESFQDTENLYLVMEYMVGGDFLGLLLRLEILPESMTQFYVAEMVLCVEEIHRMRWIHRDVKPDNFLLSSSGHLKVSDFGLAFDGHWVHNQKYHNETRYWIADRLGVLIRGDDRDSEETRVEKLELLGSPEKAPKAEEFQRPEGNLLLDSLNAQWKRRLARTIVGTSQYMAPEVIQGLRYDGRCDWWSIGIILYEVMPCCDMALTNVAVPVWTDSISQRDSRGD
jgi:serine/threonine protein kinase